MPSPDIEVEALWSDRLLRLNATVAAQGEPLAGNLFYEHNQEDFATSPASPIYRAKRDRFRKAVAGRSRILEIGVNGGHSALLALSANPDLQYHGIDICDHAYVTPAVKWLETEFPGRVFFHPGDSLKVVPRLAAQSVSFDVFHIDGAKFNYLDDIANSSRTVAVDGALVIVDDSETTSARIALSVLSRLDVVKRDPEFPPMPESDPNRHEIMGLQPTSAFQRLAIRACARSLNTARRVKALRERDSEWADYHTSRKDRR
jgi:Methyltransferase domain